MVEQQPLEFSQRANLKHLTGCPECGSVNFYVECPEINTYLWDAQEQDWIAGATEYDVVSSGGPAFVRCAETGCGWSDEKEYAPEPYDE